ncbi:DUF1616 domain-containing protein [Halegenticoccus tardaugens]|uniref:DUF1616 domain-containing protein n=1 Tax=Halegenticoccus tardaugens TaxID=2071624 RepID=UPI002265237F|nr:DUF1616 domain-containing protein [Halegenticoccus tardaugens]
MTPAATSPLRFLLGLPFVLFLPGYALLTVLFPRRSAREQVAASGGRNVRGITLGERFALSFGVSLLLVPVLLLALGTAGAITLQTTLSVVGGFIFAAAVLGAIRRFRLPDAERFRLPVGAWAGAVRRRADRTDGRETLLALILLVGVIAAASSFAYALAVPPQGAEHTEFSLLTESDSGDLVAGGYPSNVGSGESVPLVASIENNGADATQYTIVIQLQEVNSDGNVEQRTELDRFSQRVAAGETAEIRHAVVPTMTGNNLRLQYLLYEGNSPANPNEQNADQELHIWLSVG